MLRKLNWRPDLPDYRDRIYTAKPDTKLPDRVDLKKYCSAVEDQGELGSCTGQAIASAIELLDIRPNGKRMPMRAAGAAAGTWTDISRLFIYYNERRYIGTVREDSGAYIRDGIKSVSKIGAAKEALWPYDISRFRNKPPKEAYADAATRRFRSYERVTDLDSMLACLAEGYPFVFGFTCYDAFLSEQVARTGVLNMPKAGEREQGGHAVLAVGYSLASKRFTVRNSWGEGWGRKGYFTMPFDYLADRNLSDDMWTIRGA